MILKLELNSLIENGCSLEVATELMETKTTGTYNWNEGNFYVSKENNKVYTSTDFYRKVYFENGSLDFPYNCTELIPDYFNLALIDFMQKQKTVLGVLFDEAKQFEKFKIKEIERIKERITSQKEFLNKMKHHKFKSKENDIEICESYIDFLHTKEYKPQDPKENISNYFDAYSQSIFSDFYKRNEDKSINENYRGNFFADWNKRTDKFLFERETLKPIYKDLCLFNRRLSMLFDEIIGLFKVVDGYKKTQETNYHTQLYLKLEAIKRFLSSVEFCCTSINILIEDKQTENAILMKKNCSRLFIECIDSLKEFKIYIDKTPLKADFENALSNIEKSIDFNELKYLQDKPQQPEAVIPDEVRTTKRRKTLQEFINNIDDKEAFLNDLKTTFPTEIGKEIRVIIDRLKMENILILGAREYKSFLEVLGKYFNRHIGEYTGIQNKMIITAETSDPIIKKLNPLIKNYKTK
ncbi:hypothetical protein [Flavobacterium sp.]|jgi:hypothetical protein|uniref:hypothetical protein n=1 Tax=Flavobacterium sp. TaxID=239 RepID=UPI0037BF3E32